MKPIVNIVGYLLVLTGCSLTAWVIFFILDNAMTPIWAGAGLGYTHRPKIGITSPATDTVTQHMIQIIGFFPKEIDSITYDITNAAGINANQVDWQRKGYVTGQYLDRAKFERITHSGFNDRHKPWNPPTRPMRMESVESAFTTNFFQIYDVVLAKGKNCITIHLKDKNGSQYTTTKFYTLDYSGDKTPPVVTLVWPTNNSSVAGHSFTLNARVDDNNATIKATIKDIYGEVYKFDGIVERNGLVWVKDLPLGPGLNAVTLVATDDAGNSSTNQFNVTRATVSVTMRPLEHNQLNKPLVNVCGTISDATCEVAVNGITGTVHADGSWEAKAVPVSPTGMANFNISVFSKSEDRK
jgi:hypothetical protein